VAFPSKVTATSSNVAEVNRSLISLPFYVCIWLFARLRTTQTPLTSLLIPWSPPQPHTQTVTLAKPKRKPSYKAKATSNKLAEVRRCLTLSLSFFLFFVIPFVHLVI
jgi:hypothetical protein